MSVRDDIGLADSGRVARHHDSESREWNTPCVVLAKVVLQRLPILVTREILMILPKLQLTGKTHVEPKQTQILELETADT